MLNDEKTLLQHYDRAMCAHATIVVAAVFGLFSILGIASNSNVTLFQKCVLAIIYWILGAFGHYEISRFVHYGNRAKRIAVRIAKRIGGQEFKDPEGDETFAVKWVWGWALVGRRVHLVFFLFLLLSFIAVYMEHPYIELSLQN